MTEEAALQTPNSPTSSSSSTDPDLANFWQLGEREVSGCVQEFRGISTHFIAMMSAHVDKVDLQMRLLTPSAERLSGLDARVSNLETVMDELLQELRLACAPRLRASVRCNASAQAVGVGSQQRERQQRPGRASAMLAQLQNEVKMIRAELEQVNKERRRLRDQVTANASIRENAERMKSSACAQLREELETMRRQYESEKEKQVNFALEMERSNKQLLVEKQQLMESHKQLQDEKEQFEDSQRKLKEENQCLKEVQRKLKEENQCLDEVQRKLRAENQCLEEVQRKLQEEKRQLEESLPDLMQQLDAERRTVMQLENELAELHNPDLTAKMRARDGESSLGGVVQLMSAFGEWRWTVGDFRTAKIWRQALHKRRDHLMCYSSVLLHACVGGWELLLGLWMEAEEIRLTAYLPPFIDYNKQLLPDTGDNFECLDVCVKFTVGWTSVDVISDTVVSLRQIRGQAITIGTAPCDQFASDEPPIITVTVTKL